jgi:hypothetical protein
MVRREKDCCGFLNFDLREVEQEVRLTITAPEEAREAADFLFEQFVGSVEQTSSPIAAREGASVNEKTLGEREEFTTEKAARAAVVVTASGVLVWGVLRAPNSDPGYYFGGGWKRNRLARRRSSWATMIAAFVVAAAWGWVGLQSILAKAKPARTTLYVMVIATVILMLGLLWPRIEPLTGQPPDLAGFQSVRRASESRRGPACPLPPNRSECAGRFVKGSFHRS